MLNYMLGYTNMELCDFTTAFERDIAMVLMDVKVQTVMYKDLKAYNFIVVKATHL